ncbi:armadillo-type protein [Dipodascopsis tothii]|uniref:armadillo-type protein n=1 Tax=Dipodascopsis tothii TaxID=44089 RepID=UPI0034CE5BAC
MDFFKSAITSIAAKANSSAAFPYTTGDRVEFRNDTIWTLYNAVRRSDNSACSVFVFDAEANHGRVPLARNAVRKLRTLKFPGVVKVLDTFESESAIMVATEHVTPLDIAAHAESMTADALRWGLYAVTKTLKLVNVDAGAVHGNVRMSSVLVADSGEWRLSGFELTTAAADESPVLYTFGGLVPDAAKYAPPEVGKGGWEALRKQPQVVDAWGLGALVYEVFNGALTKPEQLQSSMKRQIPADMFGAFRRLVSADARSRATVKQFLDAGRNDGGFFHSGMIALSETVESLAVKSEYEREVFLKELQRSRAKFPPGYLVLRVLPELVRCFEFSGGGPKVLTVLLEIAQDLSAEDYAAMVTPTIVKMFSSPDRAIRIALLDALPKYVDLLPNKTVNDKVFPDMVTGFTDIAPAVREQSVKAVLVIIPKLSDRSINNDLLRALAKTQNDEQPGIRTNTTICLGKIANNLGPHTRGRVLTTAFTRSLRDPFVHARNAALMALAATVDVFSADDCCTKILPALCGSLLDKEKMVRTQANKTFEVYLHKVQAHQATMPDANSQPLPSPSASPAPTAGTATPRSEDGGWAGWAMSGFTKHLGVDDERGQMQQLGASVPMARPSSDTASTRPSATLTPTSTATRPSSSASSVAPKAKFGAVDDAPADDFGWGVDDLDGDGGFGDDGDDWAGFDPAPAAPAAPAVPAVPVAPVAPARAAASPPARASTPARTLSAAAPAARPRPRVAAGKKITSIAAHKEKKESNFFADAGAGDDDGWGDSW